MKHERASVADSFIPVGYESRFIDDHEKVSTKDFFMPGKVDLNCVVPTLVVTPVSCFLYERSRQTADYSHPERNTNVVRRTEFAEMIKQISPVAWRHVLFLGRFEFQKQQDHINIDEIITTLKQKTEWQHLTRIDVTSNQESYFTWHEKMDHL